MKEIIIKIGLVAGSWLMALLATKTDPGGMSVWYTLTSIVLGIGFIVRCIEI